MLTKIASIGKLAPSFPQFFDRKSDDFRNKTYCKLIANLDTNQVSIEGPFEFKSYQEYERSFAKLGNRPGNFLSFSKPLKSPKVFLKILKYFEKFDLPILQSVYQLLSKTSLKILEEKCPQSEKTRPPFLVISVVQGGVEKFLGEIEEVYNKVMELEEQNLLKEKGEWYCGVCHNYTTVAPTSKVLKFDTLDKDGFRFKEYIEEGWKVNPVCPSCRKDIENGFEFMSKFLRFKFDGDVLLYYIIPYVHTRDMDLLNEILSIFIYSERTLESASLISEEKEILRLLSEKSDMLSLEILFLAKENSAIRIVSRISDVYPSRLKVLFEAKDHTEEFFRRSFKVDLSIRLKDIYLIYSNPNQKEAIKRYRDRISEIVKRIFLGESILWDEFVSFSSKRVLIEYWRWKSKKISYDSFVNTINKILGLMVFINKLGLFEAKGGKRMETTELQKIISEAIEPFTQTNQDKFLLLLGALTAKFGEEQIKEHGLDPKDTPPVFKSIRLLDYEYARNILFPEIIRKYKYFSVQYPSTKLCMEVVSLFALPGKSVDRDRENAMFWIGTCMKGYIFSKIFEIMESKKEE